MWDYLTARTPIDSRKDMTLARFRKWLQKVLPDAALLRFAVEDAAILGMGPRAPQEIENHAWRFSNGHLRASTLRASLHVLNAVLCADLATASYVHCEGRVSCVARDED